MARRSARYQSDALWGGIGQVTGCQNNWEVGDPLTGTNFPPILMPNGVTYHPQETVFWSWFYSKDHGNVLPEHNRWWQVFHEWHLRRPFKGMPARWNLPELRLFSAGTPADPCSCGAARGDPRGAFSLHRSAYAVRIFSCNLPFPAGSRVPHHGSGQLALTAKSGATIAVAERTMSRASVIPVIEW